MKILSYVLNSILIVGIVVYITVVGIQSMNPVSVSTDLDVKKFKSSDLLSFDENKKEAKTLEKTDEDEEIEVVVEEDVDRENSAKDEKEDIITEEVSSAPQETISDVLETQVGSLSGYGPDCVGCSGFLASGIDVRNGNIYYSDSTYGNVRILAGDRSYPYGTIVRVKGSRLSEFIGIVLDRGGAVGFGKSHLFDLLYKTSAEALKNEVSYNTTFEILRYGY